MKKETNYPSIDKTHLKGTTFFERHPIIPPLTFSAVMDLMFAMQGNHKIVDCLDLEVDVKEFQKDSLIMAKTLLELGVRKKDIVTVCMPNYYQAIPVFKATNMLGAVTTYLNPYAAKEEIADYLNLYESKVFITCDLSEELNNYIKLNTKVKHIITMNSKLVNSRDFTKGNAFDYCHDIDNLDYHSIENVSIYQKSVPSKILGAKDDALILYTSGSTGKAKSIVFTNENLVSSCIYLKNSTHVPVVTDDDRRWMNIVPFMYPYGIGASVLQTFLSGREVILTPNLSPENISYYYAKNPDLIFGSPAHLEVTKKYLPKDQKIPNLKIYLSGGDFLSVSQSHAAIEYFKEHGAKNVTISNSSGTGETLGCSTNAMNVPYRPETVGQLVIGPEYVFLDPETKTKEVKYGEEAVLCTRGKHVFKEYYKEPELTKQAKIMYKGKEYYCTGNVGMLGKDRYFQLIGRSSRFFITNTFNKVYCELVQSVVGAIDVVDYCAVVPIPNADSLYRCKAYVVLKDGVEPTKEVADYIIAKSKESYIDPVTGERTTLKDYEIPESVTFKDTLPRTVSAEKVNYEALKQEAENEYNERKKSLTRVLTNN